MTKEDILVCSYEVAGKSKLPMQYMARLQAEVNIKLGGKIRQQMLEPDKVEQLKADMDLYLHFCYALNKTMEECAARFQPVAAIALTFHKRFIE